MAHHDPAIRAALVQARDQIVQHEWRKHRPVEEIPVPDRDRPQILKLSVPGSVTATTYLPYDPLFGGSIVAVFANVRDVLASDLIFDVLFNDVSIYTETAKPSIPTGYRVWTSLPPDNDTWDAATKINIQVTAAGGATDLVVSLMFIMG